MSQIKTAAPGGGRKMFLTSPFIDQAISLRTVVSVTAILRQLAGDLHLPLEAMVVVSWSWLRPSVVTVLQCRSTKVGGNQR